MPYRSTCSRLPETGALMAAGRILRAVALAAALVSATHVSAFAQGPDPQDAPPPAPARPQMVVHAFGSVDWLNNQGPGSPNSFALGQFDLFVTSAINDRVSVLAEVVMEASGADTRVVTDLFTSDPGRALITGIPDDPRAENQNAFKISALRGIRHTAPYFHDNSAKTLEDVVAHYTNFFAFVTGGGLVLTPQEQADIVAYLRLLD